MVQIWVNTLGPGQNFGYIVDNIFKCISLDKNFGIWNKIPSKYVP